ncbi:J domain-containing protein [Halomarina ordinaria]|uniref:J domain-containing protein n=1 Tax=Halomarina ordinaria TaxID=3033939 RepID=A0ABD5U6Q2_9EURY|nr:J domain-containing protein [Halomarina sp. PSRA2]
MYRVVVFVPNWLVLGVLVGLASSGVAAGIFLVGRHLYPDPAPATGSGSTESRRTTEIRQYLTAIGEPFAEDHFVEGHTVAFYLPKRDVAITFDARAFIAIDTSPTYAVLVEHEMPGFYIGGRLPFDTPEMNFGDGEDESERGAFDRTRAAFAVLGLPASASERQVKAAYREKAKATHPDQGGDPEAFKQLQEAYATARERAAS